MRMKEFFQRTHCYWHESFNPRFGRLVNGDGDTIHGVVDLGTMQTQPDKLMPLYIKSSWNPSGWNLICADGFIRMNVRCPKRTVTLPIPPPQFVSIDSEECANFLCDLYEQRERDF